MAVILPTFSTSSIETPKKFWVPIALPVLKQGEKCLCVPSPHSRLTNTRVLTKPRTHGAGVSPAGPAQGTDYKPFSLGFLHHFFTWWFCADVSVHADVLT